MTEYGTSPSSMGRTIRTIRVSEVRAPMLELWGRKIMELEDDKENLERDRSSLITLVLALKRSWKTGDPAYANEARIGLAVGAEMALEAAEEEERE